MATDVRRYITLAEKIKLRSEVGQINWSPASFVHTYEAPLGTDGMVAIQMLGNDADASERHFTLAFKNDLGRTFFNLRDTENKNFPQLHGIRSGIYAAAESMAAKADSGTWLTGMETFVDAL